MRLKDRVAIITGGGQGIGRATCLLLAKEGANIVLAEYNPETAESVGREVKELGVQCLVIQTDVSNGDSVRSMVSQALDALGRIDILVNNAGIFSYTQIEDCTEEEWDRMMAVNLKGPFLCSQAVIDTMKKQQSGRIISLGSLAGQVGGLVSSAPYAASKAGCYVSHKIPRTCPRTAQHHGQCHRSGRRSNGYDDEPSRFNGTDGTRSSCRTGRDRQRHSIPRLRRRIVRDRYHA